VSRRAALAAAALLALATGCAAPRSAVRPPLAPAPAPPSRAPPAHPPPERPRPATAGTGEGRPEPAGRPQRPLPVPLAPSEYHEEPEVVGVTHAVRQGETVYRIARAYGVDPGDLLEVNGIADPRQVAVGTELFVPGASRVVDLAETTGAPAAPGHLAHAARSGRRTGRRGRP
jgi:hypothetical protein